MIVKSYQRRIVIKIIVNLLIIIKITMIIKFIFVFFYISLLNKNITCVLNHIQIWSLIVN